MTTLSYRATGPGTIGDAAWPPDYPLSGALVDATAATLACLTPGEAPAPEELHDYGELKARHVAAWNERRPEDLTVRWRATGAETLLVALRVAWDWQTECLCGYPRVRLAVPRRRYEALQELLAAVHPGDSGAIASATQLNAFLALLGWA